MFKQTLRYRNKVMEYQKIQDSTWMKNEAHSNECLIRIVYGVIINYLKVL